MISAEDAQLLCLSMKECSVLDAMRGGLETPLNVALTTKISRPTVYDTLASLKKRGLVESRVKEGRKYWRIVDRRELEQRFFDAKRAFLKLPDGTQEVFGVDDATVIVHRGKDAIKKVVIEIVQEHKNERLYGFQGDAAATNWDKVFSIAETNHLNRSIKKNLLIVEAILPDGWFERQARELGIEWAKDFEGRATRTNVINAEYFTHGGQLFMFKNSIYLMALGEEIVIEIRNSEIQKMLLSFFKFIQDNSRVIDANELLRSVIASMEGAATDK